MSDDQIKTAAEAAENAALPEAYAVHVDADGSRTTEKTAPPKAGKPLADKSPAEWAYERIVMYIQKFEETLDAKHEVGMGFAGSDAGSVKIQGMGYFAPDMVTFYGADGEGNKMQLVQHVSQLNVMLVAEPKSEEAAEPNRIGFQLAQDLDTETDAGS
ncbi:hypothetical protein GCM10007939_21830 [Amylibacter marinus]|uniref:Uncharacterized protein n=1 Tax=Amylibacter marinus TaxID=1475483 RepID=A0ABQ5VXN1_9RHOB|nr:DUF6173 family protein [Amylibacter marinus]GLQ35899.1 hypothetical protein GCM10007939_21830 [Amylibacter marinus]